MFDQTTPPLNLPTSSPLGPTPAPEPEDIFSGVETGSRRPVGASPSMTSSASFTAPLTPPSAAMTDVQIKAPLIGSRTVIIILALGGGIILLAALGYGAWRFVRRATTPLPAPGPEAEETAPLPPSLPPVPELPTASPTLPEVTEMNPTPEPAVTTPLDSDSDGLSDAEESAAQTDPVNPDSDSDGLFDGEEVRTYQTDPRNPDSDNDKYPDGQEVRNGYNPKGTGKLFAVPAQ